MKKLYCDKCKKQIKEDFFYHKIFMYEGTQWFVRADIEMAHDGRAGYGGSASVRPELCESCKRKIIRASVTQVKG